MRGGFIAAAGAVDIDGRALVEEASVSALLGETFTRAPAAVEATKKSLCCSMKSRCCGSIEAKNLLMTRVIPVLAPRQPSRPAFLGASGLSASAAASGVSGAGMPATAA